MSLNSNIFLNKLFLSKIIQNCLTVCVFYDILKLVADDNAYIFGGR